MAQPNYYDSQSPDYVGRRSGSFGFGGLVGGGSTATAAAPAPVKHGTESELWDLAQGITQQENSRYGRGLDALLGAYGQSQRTLSETLDPSLLFSKAADAIGAKSVENMNALRQSLGARGINPNSGAASALMSRQMFNQQNDVIGATRDVAIENQRNRQVAAAQNFANAMNLAGYMNSPVSGAQLETSQNIFEGDLAREGIKAQAKSNKAANKTNLLGSLIGTAGSVLGGLI